MISGLSNDVFIAAMEVLSHSNAATTILVHKGTGSVLLEEGTIPKGAYGVAQSKDKILVNANLLKDPVRLGIVIVHELTHCLDFGVVGDLLRTGGKGWTSEINAHMNQGLVMRELIASMPKSHARRGDLEAMAKSPTTFGHCVDWTSRKLVAAGIKGPYRELKAVSDFIYQQDIDQSWEKPGKLHYFPGPVQSGY